MDISKLGKGALVSKPSLKDYRLEVVPRAGEYPSEFSNREKIGKIKSQNGSSSCVAQATAYYAELKNFIETKKKTELSARFIYSKTYINPDGGSFIKDALARLCNCGIALEEDIPSYDNGKATEEYMRKSDDFSQETTEKAMDYMAKKYVTWNTSNVDLFKRAIVEGDAAIVASWGDNNSWAIGKLKLPTKLGWRHGILIIGYSDKKQCFEFVNSWDEEWGDNGFGWMPYEYIEHDLISAAYTVVDLPNGTYTTMQKVRGVLYNLVELYKKLIALKVADNR